MASVKGASALASDPRYISPSPWPIASGEPCARRSSDRPRPQRQKRAQRRRQLRQGAFTASAVTAFLHLSVTRWQQLRVGLGTEFRAIFLQLSRSSRKFSMMPFCTTARRSGVRMRVAFGRRPMRRPRVWPIPLNPATARSRAWPRFFSLPSARRRSRCHFPRSQPPRNRSRDIPGA